MSPPPRSGPRARQPIGGRLAVSVVALAVAGCSLAQSEAVPVPDPVPTVDIRVADDDLTIDGPVPAGHVVSHVHNTGSHPHRLAVFRVENDAPSIHEEIADDEERPVRILARVTDLEPGATGKFALDVAAGQRYAMVDLSTGPDGTRNLTRGVAGEFTAQPPATPPPTPDP